MGHPRAHVVSSPIKDESRDKSVQARSIHAKHALRLPNKSSLAPLIFHSPAVQGDREAAYAASEIMSSTVSFSTEGFMRALPIPARVPCLKS